MELEIDNFSVDYNFPTTVYQINKPEYLSIVSPVLNLYINNSLNESNLDPIYPGIQTQVISGEESIEPFVRYISDISWDVLNSQGYDMDLYYTDAMAMWGHYHDHLSGMEQHVHGLGAQLTGFYFVDVPEDSCLLYFYDPRPAKVYANLVERQGKSVTPAHTMVYYKPKAGDLFFAPAWLAHSFTRNKSTAPFKFVHINVHVVLRENNNQSAPVII